MRKLKNIYSFDFILLGIVTSDKDYIISHKINQNLGLKLSVCDDLIIDNEMLEVKQTFSLYKYIDESFVLEYRLFKNIGYDGYLIPENKNIDYFLQIIGEIAKEKIQKYLVKLKNLDGVLTTINIDTSKLKSINKLYF